MPALRRWLVVVVLGATTLLLFLATDAGIFVVLGDHWTSFLNPWGFVLVDRALRFPATIAAAALLMFGITATVVARADRTRIAVAFGSVLTGTLAAVAGIPALLGTHEPAGGTAYPAPGGRLVVLANPGMDYFLHTTGLVVRTRDGWRSRQHQFACLEGATEEFEGLEWLDARTVRVRTSGGDVRFTFDDDGTPDRVLGTGNNC